MQFTTLLLLLTSAAAVVLASPAQDSGRGSTVIRKDTYAAPLAKRCYPPCFNVMNGTPVACNPNCPPLVDVNHFQKCQACCEPGCS
ncbi:hypothetical protein H2198_006792 [Neophaeococcomyces mojaviensis]|uniref:Uncharacterized protein n=1 Tax=Neophaeococcomyces mojaviensis TaxID=3383035 RepID=A0ACC3A1X8_9EURO|nr:hypothetical protein H2198_006792 [Knufia sp. JES_112]